jgi:preprotein translocase subunit Sss1
MRLTIFMLFFSFMLSPVSSIARQYPNVIRDTSGQIADRPTSTEHKEGFLRKLLPSPDEEQFNKILKVKWIFVILMIVGFIGYLIYKSRDKRWRKENF